MSECTYNIATVVEKESTPEPVPRHDPVPELVKIYSIFLNFAKNLTQNQQTAEDLVQDAYIKLIKMKDRLTDDNTKGWMLTTIRNMYISQCRHTAICQRYENKRAKQLLVEEQSEQLPDFEKNEISPHIAHAIDDLPGEYRNIFVDFINGMQYADVAAKYQIPAGTVMSRFWRARKLLQERLGGHKIA